MFQKNVQFLSYEIFLRSQCYDVPLNDDNILN